MPAILVSDEPDGDAPGQPGRRRPGAASAGPTTTPNETGFAVQRSTDGVTFTPLATAPAHAGTGAVTFVDTTVTFGDDLHLPGGGHHRRRQLRLTRTPPRWSSRRSLRRPSGLTAANGANQGNNRRVVLTWVDNANNETGFTVQRATNAGFTVGVVNTAVAANAITVTITGLNRNTDYYFRIRANNGTVVSSGWVTAMPLPIHTLP